MRQYSSVRIVEVATSSRDRTCDAASLYAFVGVTAAIVRRAGGVGMPSTVVLGARSDGGVLRPSA